MPDQLPTPDFEKGAPGAAREDPQQIVNTLIGYAHESENARKSGPENRDDVMKANWDLYWGRFDFSKKAEWQSREVMPEPAQFVDRWAAALRQALSQQERFYTVKMPADKEKDLDSHIFKFMGMLLEDSGRTATGHAMDFAGVFEELMKLGSLSMICASVTWEPNDDGGRLAIEPTDPRKVWIDPTGRRMYRRRRFEMDKHELLAMAKDANSASGKEGKPFDMEAIGQLIAQTDKDGPQERETASGHGSGEADTKRIPIVIDEFLCTLLDSEGGLIAENALIMLANERHIIRGPEENPFWHKHDWILFSPMITMPFAPYGRTYMENWGPVARTFTEMTNLILDATFTSSMNAYAAAPDMLEDPSELEEGISPNKVFQMAEGELPKDFMKEIELGRLPPEAIRVWQDLKAEMREGAALSEISLGQLAPKSDTTATEISAVQQSSSSLIQSIAKTIEERFLEPLLEMVFLTGMQHVDFTNPRVVARLGEDTIKLLLGMREEFKTRRLPFKVDGISSLIQRGQELRKFLNFFQTIGGIEPLLKAFTKRFSMDKVLDHIMTLFGVDPLKLQETEREQKIRQASEASAPQLPPGEGATPGLASPPRVSPAPQSEA